MSTELTLPLQASQLPESVRRFADPDAPGPAKLMAAKGLVPVKGADLVILLVQLSADADEAVSKAANSMLTGLPPAVLHSACETPLPAAILHHIALEHLKNDDVIMRIAGNQSCADATIEKIALYCSEPVSEIIAVNQQRILGAPTIIEALYKNRNTRMSTADRLIELCARNGVELHGIPAFHAHVEAIKGQLIAEAEAEASPTDLLFSEALAHDADEEAHRHDHEEGTEELVEEFIPLQARIREMNIGEKLRLALLGNSAARSILVRDPNKIVSMAAISAPTVNENEAKNVAHSREVPEDVLRFIAKKKEWIRSYEIKRALMYNPKTPIGISMNLLAHLRRNDLKFLTTSRGIPGPLKAAARQRMKKFE